jgi:hypothetical protein
MKNSIDTIGKRTRDLPACSAVSPPNALPRGKYKYRVINRCLSEVDVFRVVAPSIC